MIYILSGTTGLILYGASSRMEDSNPKWMIRILAVAFIIAAMGYIFPFSEIRF